MAQFARLRDVVPSAYLRVFQPLDAFERQEQLHWERDLLDGSRSPSLRPRYADRPTSGGLGVMAPADGEHAEIRVVDDQHGCPTAAYDIARAIVVASGRLLVGSGAFGTFHFCGLGSTSWYGFAQAIFELSEDLHPKLVAIPTSARPTPARRPANSTLDGAKFRRLYGVAGRPWRESLARCLREIAAREATTA